MIKMICPYLTDLAEKEYGFVRGVETDLDFYGACAKISDKQLFWLRDIKAKYVDGQEDGKQEPFRRRNG